MNFYLRYLLLPITIVLWYSIIYFGLTYSILGVVYIFDFHWLILFLFISIFTGLIYAGFTLPLTLIILVLNKLYKLTWLSVVLHSIAGFLACIDVLISFYNFGFGFDTFWIESKFKTAIVLFPVLGLIYSCFISGSFGLINYKLQNQERKPEVNPKTVPSAKTKMSTLEREMLKLKLNQAAEQNPDFKAKIMKLKDEGNTNKEQK